VNNTQLSQTTAISTQAAQSVTFKGVGITQVNVVNNEVAVQARPGFSGKTTVSITVTSAEEVSTITADVIVIPLPVTNPVVRVVSEDRARIQWVRSPNAVTYEVTQNGRLLCTTSRTICTVTEPVSEATPVQIKALGRDQTESTVKQATYVDATIPRVIPEVALVVNFDTAKFNLDNEDRRLIREFAADVARFGFKEVDISGHTDSRGGIDNNVLSNNRAKSARAYLLSLLPNLKVTINGFADAINVAPNTTVEGLAANRRAEFRVVG
jgi:outer membrane protein OmpA-like peptidoglycan-associated protein